MQIIASMPYARSRQQQNGYPITYTTSDIGGLARFVRGPRNAGAITRLQSALVDAADNGVNAMTTALRSHYAQIFDDHHGFDVRLRATTEDMQESGTAAHFYRMVRFGQRRFGDDQRGNGRNMGQSMVNSLADVLRQMDRHADRLDEDFGQAEMQHLAVIAIVAFYSNVVMAQQANARRSNTPPMVELLAVAD